MDAYRSCVGAVAGMLPGALAATSIAYAEPMVPPALSDAEQMSVYAGFVNELSQRRRRAVYFDNTRAVFDGVGVGHVSVGTGSVSFARRDLVVPAALPVVVQRIYASDKLAAADFGTGGWHLSLAERIEMPDSASARFHTSTAATLDLVRSGNGYRLAVPRPSDFDAFILTDDGALEVTRRDGLTRRFERSGRQYLLRRVEDRWGNSLTLRWDADERLASVSGDGGARVEFARDSAGRIITVTDDAGHRVGYSYDQAGRLATVTDRGGRDWHYDYDDANRITAAFAPGGALDLAVEWDQAGRARSMLSDGSWHRFDYDLVDVALPGLTLTRVSRPDGAVMRLGQNALGMTTFAEDFTGHRTSLRLTPTNAVGQLASDDDAIAQFGYDAHGRVADARVRGDDGMLQDLEIRRDNPGRLIAVVDDTGHARVSIDRSADGRHFSVQRHSALRRFELDRRGLLAVYQPGPTNAYRLDHDDRGRPIRIEDIAGRAATMRYKPGSALDSVRYADGTRIAYDYAATGLRALSARDSGGRIRYRYTPSGSLYRLERITTGGTVHASSYQLDPDGRVQRLLHDTQLYHFDYMPTGSLRRVQWHAGALAFGYDDAGRLVRVQFDDEPPLDYRYRPGEPDLRLQVDVLAHPTSRGRIDAGSTFGSYAQIVLDRSIATAYGPIAYDASIGRFVQVFRYGVEIPGDAAVAMLARTRLVASDGASPGITGGGDNGYGGFNAPSNPLFVPAEYRSVNCFFCPPSLPFALPLNGRPADDLPSTSLVLLAMGLTRCGVGGHEPPDDCSLSVSGQPLYLCNLQQAGIGATLSPPSLNDNAISWSIHGDLVQVPVGGSGATTGIRGASTVNGQGTIRAKFSSASQLCHSNLVTVPVRANDPQTYQQVISLDACPERQQDADYPHQIDGCSIPPVTTLIFPGDVQDPVGGTRNTPGTSTAFGAPQAPLPYGSAPLALPCNRHDVCYQTCGQAQLGCDNAILDEMHAVCATAYPETCPYPGGTLACVEFFNEQFTCGIVTEAIFDALRLFGSPSWQQRQVDYCDCCPP